MESFNGKLAVVTGGGSGMGRQLVVQLAAEGCSVATCDLHAEDLATTKAAAESPAPRGARVTTHMCDVADESQVLRFRDEVEAQHGSDHLDLLFNNAGIGGGGSMITDTREVWERTFAVDWWGVYYCTRTFLPLLMASDDAMLVNTSSVNGFLATLGAGIPHTAYSTAKFAVKGFSEALIVDLRTNAPNVKVAVVMPGHIGTDIFFNTRRALGQPEPEEIDDAELESLRSQLARAGFPASEATAEDLRNLVRAMGEGFRDNAPLDAAQAATIILDGVRAGKWRILVGKDAEALDEWVRADPERAYEPDGLRGLRLTREP
ncbi:MAG TPA: SDR family NAD(P)-dependent oxidoreductase [Acidimicrobiales bacterium]|nr:SDR family NAD(P)-dependent oxidoreductase [Acidimicrobiales bacterium]